MLTVLKLLVIESAPNPTHLLLFVGQIGANTCSHLTNTYPHSHSIRETRLVNALSEERPDLSLLVYADCIVTGNLCVLVGPLLE